jgi:queuosine precursor transporter
LIPNNKPLELNSKYILLIAMLYVTVSLAADVVAFKFALFFGLTESGATVIFPLTYVLGDIVCEVYGWDSAMKIVWLGLICEVLFALLVTVIIHLKSSGIGQFQNEYTNVLGRIWIFVLAGVFSNAIAGLFNIFLISKWKVLTKGRFFWIRSILSTCISEFILILVTVLIAFAHFIHFKATMHVFLNAYLLEIIYAGIFVIPAQLLVKFLKLAENIDAYDHGTFYNPFKFS